MIHPPRIYLGNELIVRRHVIPSCSLTLFANSTSRAGISELSGRCCWLPTPLPRRRSATPEQMPAALAANAWVLDRLISPELQRQIASRLEADIRDDFTRAAQYFDEEARAYEEALTEKQAQRNSFEKARQFDKSQKLTGFMTFLQRRIEAMQKVDWVSFFSDRSVLPGYAFPIHNVILDTSDPDLKLIAICESPSPSTCREPPLSRRANSGGAPVFAGHLERTSTARQYYAVCPKCWYVERHPLDPKNVFAAGKCPVCGDDGKQTRRTPHVYEVPAFGFTTDLKKPGEELTFERPLRIRSSRVLSLPNKARMTRMS